MLKRFRRSWFFLVLECAMLVCRRYCDVHETRGPQKVIHPSLGWRTCVAATHVLETGGAQKVLVLQRARLPARTKPARPPAHSPTARPHPPAVQTLRAGSPEGAGASARPRARLARVHSSRPFHPEMRFPRMRNQELGHH